MTPQPEAAAQKYLALVQVSSVIASHRDLAELFDKLAECLHQLLGFHYLMVALHDNNRRVMQLHVLHSWRKQVDTRGLEFPVDGSPSGEVWTTQEVRNFKSVAELQQYPPVYQLLREHRVASFCSLPLTTAQRRIGAISFGRASEGGYSDEELEFGKLVAAQVAVAVDNALHYEEALALQKELARESNRLRLMLEINNSIVSNLDLLNLFQAISASLRRVIRHDSASLMLPDPQLPDTLRLYALDFPDGRGFLQQDMPISIKSSNPGKAFLTGEPILAGSSPGYVPYQNPYNTREGLRSSLLLPLVIQGSESSLGVLALASRLESAFSQQDLAFLRQIAQQIAIGVRNALEHRKLSESAERVSEQKLYLEEELRSEQGFEAIVGSSSPLKSVLQQVETVAPTDSTVLIQGETGTGKELIARAIHDRSTRRDRTFVKINCAAIPLGLLESELFGHEKGAFTGAIARKIGRFELAHQGTLFLDEIADVPLELQPKLLRVLQEQEFERLGGTTTHKVDVRVIAATNRSLLSMVTQGGFRSDLFYRLNVFPILLPPLRERPEDIPLLARHFTSKYARRMNRAVPSIAPSVLAAMSRYFWPGNVRELQNFIERAVILSSDGELRAPLSELKAALAPPSGGATEAKTLRDVEREHILEALEKANWVVGGPSGAAAMLGMKRTSLLYRMEKLQISRAHHLSA